MAEAGSFDVSLLADWPDQTLEDIVEAIRDGAQTPAEVFGFGPEALNAIERMALGYYRARHFERAASIYGFLLRMQPQRSSAWRGLGAVCQGAKNYYLAVKCYQQAAETNPDDVIARVLWGECLCQVGQRDKGVPLLEEVIAKGTKDQVSLPYITRARAIVGAKGGLPTRVVLMNQGRSLAADAHQALLDEGFEPLPHESDELIFDPNKELTADDMLKNPELKKLLGELREALADGRLTYAEIGGFTPNELDGAYACACKYAEMGQVLEALKIAGYLIFLDPYGARYYQLVGICLQRLKQYEPAEHYFDLALVIDKDDVMSRVYMGECRIMAGRVDEGVATLKEAIAAGDGKAEVSEVVERGKVLVKQFGGAA